MNGIRVRRNIEVHPEDGEKYVKGVLALKSAPSRLPPANGSPNRYDDFVLIHRIVGRRGHQRPAFLPWHRAYLARLDREIQQALNDDAFALPYWKWEDHDPGNSILWSNDLLGSDGDRANDDRVMAGPFALDDNDPNSWRLNINPSAPINDPPYLKRAFGKGQGTFLPRAADVDAALNIEDYDTPPWDTSAQGSFRNTLEGFAGPSRIHNMVHMWVGGSMVRMTSPNDPVFFLHHCNLDRLWALWQARRKENNKPFDYLPGDQEPDPQGISLAGHRLNDRMWPWFVESPGSMNDHRSSLNYIYDDEDENLEDIAFIETDPPEELAFSIG